jgi:uncharacterized protein YjbJ (UPF0337 family)
VAGQFEASPAFVGDASIISHTRKHAAGRNNGRNACVRPDKTKTQKESIMNWDRVEGDWKQIKGKVQQQWGKLTDDDLDVIEGKRTELAGRLQERYGYAQDEAEKQIDSWMKSIN